MSFPSNFATNNSTNPLIATFFETLPVLVPDNTSKKTTQVASANIFSFRQDSTESKNHDRFSDSGIDYYSLPASSYAGNAQYVALNAKMIVASSHVSQNSSFDVEELLSSFVKTKEG